MLMNVFEFCSCTMCGSTNIKLKGLHVKQCSVIRISCLQAHLTSLYNVACAQTIRPKSKMSFKNFLKVKLY